MVSTPKGLALIPLHTTFAPYLHEVCAQEAEQAYVVDRIEPNIIGNESSCEMNYKPHIKRKYVYDDGYGNQSEQSVDDNDNEEEEDRTLEHKGNQDMEEGEIEEEEEKDDEVNSHSRMQSVGSKTNQGNSILHERRSDGQSFQASKKRDHATFSLGAQFGQRN